MEFRILGPLEVAEDGEPVALGTLKERLVLGVLLLHANEFVSRERLIDDLWGEAPPPTARQAVNVYLSKVRKTLSRAGADPIATASGGYQLLVDPERLDAGRMQRLVATAREHVSRGGLESAAAHFEEALSLWRGSTLAGLPLESRGRDEVARLDELRLAVLMDRIDCDIALGRHEQALGELGVLVREHPLRERLRAQQMLALYRADRQADALDAYAEARRTFVDDLGIEPSQPLQRLQQAILRHDPSLETPEGTAAQSTRSVFVGRQRELAQLAACFSEAFDGHGRLLLLAGEPGIGKSRLADELSTRARARGARVLVGRCWEAGGAPAYWPWVQSLRAYIREAEFGALRQQLGRGACDLVPLLPELRELYPDLNEPPALEPESARFRLFDAVSSFFRAAAHARPLVLFLDDLHAADEPSLLLLRFVARELGDSRVLILAAYRDVDPTIRDPLSATLAELSREPVTRRIELAGLTESEVAEYISLTASLDPEHAVVTAIHAETDGNPLFVAEVTSLLLGEGALAADSAPTRIRIPQGVRDVISRRLRRMTEDVQRLLEIASVLGREFPLDALVRLSDFSEGALLDALDVATAEGIVGDVPDAPGRLRFTHVLIRDTLYQELTLARRVRLHKRAGEVLETAYAAGIEPHLAELAHHFAEAAATGDVDKAISYARRAGDLAAALLAFEEAVRLFQLGLSLTEADDPARRRQRCELLVVLGDVQARTGDTPAARESFRVAADLAGEIGAAEPLAHAALGYGGRFMWTRSEDDRVVPLLEQAAQALGKQESSLRVMVLARLASALRALAPERSSALSEEALEVARRLREPGTLAHAISGRLWSTVAPVELDERWALATELVQAEDKERMYEGHGYRMIVLLARADIPGFRRELTQLAEIADALGQPSQRWWVAAQRANLALLEGRLGDAENLIETARTLGERAESYDALNFFELQRFALRSEQGRMADVLPDLEQSVARDPSRPLLRSALALTYWEVGQEERARRLFDELAARKFGQLPVNNDWLFAASLLAKLAASAGEAVKADDLYSRLAPFDGLNVDNTEVSTGAVSHYLALLSAATGHFERAESHFEDALALNQRMGARPWLAHTQREYGSMLAVRGKTERAHQLVTAALATYRDLGMERYAAKTTPPARKSSSVTLRQ